MTEYTKVRNSGMVLAKRGYCFFLYPSTEHLAQDDRAESMNCARINAGLPVFNRCYSSNMCGYTRKLRDVDCLEKYVLESISALGTTIEQYISLTVYEDIT